MNLEVDNSKNIPATQSGLYKLCPETSGQQFLLPKMILLKIFKTPGKTLALSSVKPCGERIKGATRLT